jgi:hypothetical protein
MLCRQRVHALSARLSEAKRCMRSTGQMCVSMQRLGHTHPVIPQAHYSIHDHQLSGLAIHISHVCVHQSCFARPWPCEVQVGSRLAFRCALSPLGALQLLLAVMLTPRVLATVLGSRLTLTTWPLFRSVRSQLWSRDVWRRDLVDCCSPGAFP